VRSPVHKAHRRASSIGRLDRSIRALPRDPLANEVLENVLGILKRRGLAVEEDVFRNC
jgi:hypothetical protein